MEKAAWGIGGMAIPENFQKACRYVLETWLSGGLGSSGLIFELADIEGLFQPY